MSDHGPLFFYFSFRRHLAVSIRRTACSVPLAGILRASNSERKEAYHNRDRNVVLLHSCRSLWTEHGQPLAHMYLPNKSISNSCLPAAKVGVLNKPPRLQQNTPNCVCLTERTIAISAPRTASKNQPSENPAPEKATITTNGLRRSRKAHASRRRFKCRSFLVQQLSPDDKRATKKKEKKERSRAIYGLCPTLSLASSSARTRLLVYRGGVRNCDSAKRRSRVRPCPRWFPPRAHATTNRATHYTFLEHVEKKVTNVVEGACASHLEAEQENLRLACIYTTHVLYSTASCITICGAVSFS